MYKPGNIREFVTPALIKIASYQTKNGRSIKTFTNGQTLRGKFKQVSTAEQNANGLQVVSEKVSYITWFTSQVKSGDVLHILGNDYEIIGEVENVEGRSRYIVLTLSRIKGGA